MKEVLVFTKKRFIKINGSISYKINKGWVNQLNGLTMLQALRKGYFAGINNYKTIKIGGNK